MHLRFSLFAGVYDYIFIESGSPDSYLSGDVTHLINDSMLYNITGNTTIDTINGTRTSTDEDVGDLIIMAVISIVLGLMILITVIGNYYLFLMLSLFYVVYFIHETYNSLFC